MKELTIINQNGQLLVDSRDVAQMVDVRHSDLLEKISGYIHYLENGKFRSQDFFTPNTYKTEGNNKTYDCYYLTRKGCDMIANKLTGEKGVLFTATYVTRFEEMEIELRSAIPLQIDSKFLFSIATQLEEKERQIALMAPKAESYDNLMDAEGCLTMDEVAKTLDIKNVGRNNLFKLLVLEKIVYKKGDIYLPMQAYKSHFIVKQNPLKIGNKVIERSQLFMTTKGLDWLARTLTDRGYIFNCNKH